MRLGPLVLIAFAATTFAKDIPLPEPAIVPSVFYESSPAIASDGDSYLSVWVRDGVRAARISRTGELIDRESLAVSTLGADTVRVAWIGSSYLVVYAGSYALVSSNGEVLKRDESLGVAARYLNALAWNGRDVLLLWVEPVGRTSTAVMSLFDSNLLPIRPRIEMGAFAIAPAAEGFVAFSTSSSGILATSISNDGTVTPAELVVSGSVTSAAAASDGRNILVAWADTAVHTVLLATLTVNNVPGASGSNLNVTAGGNGFLLTWSDDRGLLGSRLNAAGQAIDTTPFRISNVNWFGGPRGASSGDSYFLIWTDGRRTPFYLMDDVWGAHVPASRPDAAREFPIALSPANQTAPAAAFSGAIGLVAWNETGVDEISRIVAARFTPDGTFLDPRGIELAAQGAGASMATDGRDFLVVWRDAFKPRDREQLVRAVLVRANGSVGSVQTLSFEGGSAPPHVTFDGENYFVAWDNGESTEERHIDGIRVNRDGHAVDPFPFEYGPGMTPAIAFDGVNNWIVFRQVGMGYVARRVSRDGFPVESTPIVLDGSATDPSEPTITCGTGGKCLAAWNHFSITDSSDLYGAVLSSNGTVGAPFPIATVNQQLGAAIATNGTEFFLTWPEWNGQDYDVRGARVSANGDLLGIFSVATTGLNEAAAAPLLLNGAPAVIFSKGGNVGSERFAYRLFLRTEIEETRRRAVRR